VIDRLWSPEPAIARVEGTGASSAATVTVDGQPGDVVGFDLGDDDSFDIRIFVEDEGAHTVCVGDTCGRVYTLDADAETPDEVIAKIDEAVDAALGIVPFDEWFPEWTVEVGGLLAGTGGSIDADTKTVIVYRNRGRTLDDFVRTVFHEFGHVADAEWLDDDRRDEFAALRGFSPETPWRVEGSHRLEAWAASPSEDFAEAMAVWWSDGRWEIRTDGGSLDDEQRRFFDELTVAGPAG
jgi:hypothetical protein